MQKSPHTRIIAGQEISFGLRGKGLFELLPGNALFPASAFYILLFWALYFWHFGLNTRALACTALFEVSRNCVGHDSATAILRGFLNPFSINVLPSMLLYGGILLALSMRPLLEARGFGEKHNVATVKLLGGFYGGFYLARAVLVFGAIFSGAPSSIIASVAPYSLINTITFIYIYMLYAISNDIRWLLPNPRKYEIEYGFLCDSLFALIASGLFALGLDGSVDVATSGAVFIVCSVIAMFLYDYGEARRKRRGRARIHVADYQKGDVPKAGDLGRVFNLARNIVDARQSLRVVDGVEEIDAHTPLFDDEASFFRFAIGYAFFGYIMFYCIMWLFAQGFLWFAAILSK
jgi:hypothetical protein